MENHHFYWVNQLEITIFNGYVKVPEGKMFQQPIKHYSNSAMNYGSLIY